MKRLYFIILAVVIMSCSNSNNHNNKNMNEDITENEEITIYSRDKFIELFYGKPRDFVEKKLGTADKVQELFAINATWLWYKHKTYIASPDALDEWVKIKFNDFVAGTVVKINYK